MPVLKHGCPAAFMLFLTSVTLAQSDADARGQLDEFLKAINERPLAASDKVSSTEGRAANGRFVVLESKRIRARLNPATGHVRYVIFLNRPVVPLPVYLKDAAKSPAQLTETARWMIRRAGFDLADLKDPVGIEDGGVFEFRAKDRKRVGPSVAPVEVRLDRMSGALLSLRILERPDRPKPETSPILPGDPIPGPFKTFVLGRNRHFGLGYGALERPDAIRAVSEEAAALGMQNEFDPNEASAYATDRVGPAALSFDESHRGLRREDPRHLRVMTSRMIAIYDPATQRVNSISFTGRREFPAEPTGSPNRLTRQEAIVLAQKLLTERGYFPPGSYLEGVDGDRVLDISFARKVHGYQALEDSTVVIDLVSGDVIELRARRPFGYPTTLKLRPLAQLREELRAESRAVAGIMDGSIKPPPPIHGRSLDISEPFLNYRWFVDGDQGGAKLIYGVTRYGNAMVDAEQPRPRLTWASAPQPTKPKPVVQNPDPAKKPPAANPVFLGVGFAALVTCVAAFLFVRRTKR